MNQDKSSASVKVFMPKSHQFISVIVIIWTRQSIEKTKFKERSKHSQLPSTYLNKAKRLLRPLLIKANVILYRTEALIIFLQ